jgi:tetratricopeptide (TPR) repeat protein
MSAQCQTGDDNTEQFLRNGHQDDGALTVTPAEGKTRKTANEYLEIGKAWESAEVYHAALDAYLAAWGREGGNPEVEAAVLREEFLLLTYPRSVEKLAVFAAKRRNLKVWRFIARLCERRGDYDKAVAFLTQAVQNNSRDVASLSMLARSVEKSQGMEAAIPWHQRILELNPNLRASLFCLAQWQYTRGEYLEAIPYFERLLFKERGNRICELYWLLANVHYYGFHGLEARLATVRQWQDLKPEEQPLLQELLLLAGKQSLDEEKLAQAEQYLVAAQGIASSPEVTRLLASLAKREEKLGPEVKAIEAAPAQVGNTATVQPKPLDPMQWQIGAGEVSYRQFVQEKQQEHTPRRSRLVGKRTLRAVIGVMLLVGGIVGAQRSQEWAQFPIPQEQGVAEVGEERKDVTPAEQSVSSSAEAEAAPAMPPPEQEQSLGVVMTVPELGLRVSGAGAREPQRSVAGLRQEVEDSLFAMRDAYEQARMADSSLLGSVRLTLIIEPNGRSSRVRVRSAKGLDKEFQETIRTLASQWRFSPAARAVRVECLLLFLPPDLDAPSVAIWESKTIADR